MHNQTKRNAELYSRLQSGDLYSLERLIVENLPLVKLFARDFLRRRPSYRRFHDELISAGQLTLVESLNRLAKPHKQIKKIASYLRTAMMRSFLRAAARAEIFGPCFRTCQNNDMQLGEEQTETLPANLPDHIATAEQRSAAFDEIAACCEDERDCQIVKLRLLGLKDVAIAERLGTNQPNVLRRRHAIERRLKERQLALSA